MYAAAKAYFVEITVQGTFCSINLRFCTSKLSKIQCMDKTMPPYKRFLLKMLFLDVNTKIYVSI